MRNAVFKALIDTHVGTETQGGDGDGASVAAVAVDSTPAANAPIQPKVRMKFYIVNIMPKLRMKIYIVNILQPKVNEKTCIVQRFLWLRNFLFVCFFVFFSYCQVSTGC